jgi:hypothetical protein
MIQSRTGSPEKSFQKSKLCGLLATTDKVCGDNQCFLSPFVASIFPHYSIVLHLMKDSFEKKEKGRLKGIRLKQSLLPNEAQVYRSHIP